jgi:phage FluMu protein Com
METLTFQCGHCNKLMAVGVANLGQQVRCPHCQQVVIAPSQPAPTSPLPEAANEPDPLAASPATDSPFAVAPDAPWSATPAATGMDPPSAPVPPPPSPDDPFRNLNAPQLELTAPKPASAPAAPSPLKWYEEAVLDSTPPGPANAAVLESPAPHPEPPPPFESPAEAVPPAVDAAVPWGDAGASGSGTALSPPSNLPRPKRSQLGMTLFISLVFLPLVLYAVLVTILAANFWTRLPNGEGGGGGQSDPREFLPDEGEHPGIRHSKQSWGTYPDNLYTDRLPRSLRVALGKTLTIGDLEVQPERVEWGKVRIHLGTKLEDVPKPTLILHLKLRNASNEVSFYPLDTYFNREWKPGDGPKPLTMVEAGQNRFYGGPAHFGAREPEAIEGSNFDKELAPGESGQFLVCTNSFDDAAQKLSKHTGPLLWRVQLRRGLVRYRDKDYSATAVIGVEFSDKDVVRAAPKN